MPIISKFIASETYKSIPQEMEWDHIPDFSVITGKNGTGKSQLLEIMAKLSGINICYLSAHQKFAEKYNGTPSAYQETANSKRTQIIDQFKVLIEPNSRNLLKDNNIDLLAYIDWGDYIRKEEASLQTKYGLNNFSLIYQTIFKSFQTINQYRPIFEAISKKLNKRLEDITLDEFIDNIPTDIDNKFSSAEMLTRWFSLYLSNYDAQSGKANREKNDEALFQIRQQKEPWNIMNEIFEEHGFKYQIKEFDNRSNPLKIELVDDKGTTISIEELSSGEQQLVALVAWAHHDIVSQNVQLLLLDEPDAHLHPSFCKIFMSVIQKYIVEKGIQVIMATHSPSTIAYAPEDAIFVMNEIDVEPRIEKQNKEKALDILTDGLARINNEVLKTVGLIFNQNIEQKLLICEGKTDVINIKQMGDLDTEYAIINAGGADNIPIIIPIIKQMGRNPENTIVLLDKDKKGDEVKEKLDKQKWTSYIQLEGDIEKITGLFEHTAEFKAWCLEEYPDMNDSFDDSVVEKPSGKKSSIGCPYRKFIENKPCNEKIRNPLTDQEEEASNVFKNLWCEYLKEHSEYYQSLKGFLLANLRVTNPVKPE